MGSLGNPKTWVPYMNTKDCSQGFCSLYCPQWCYIIFPPPPPFEFPDDNSGSNFSPLVIAIIGILAAAFLLVSYYAIVSKYCGNINSARRQNRDTRVESEDNQNPWNHEHFHVATNGLDEAMINSIKVCKYKKGDGLIHSSDCSVCLGEFQEDESLRLLPKCSHAFHVTCIDVWLKSHSNCPLCRANVGIVNAFPIQLSPPATESSANVESPVNIGENDSVVVGGREILHNNVRNSVEGDSIIEIRVDDDDQRIRRSVSMDYSHQSRVSISDMLRIDQDEELQIETRKYGRRSRVLHSVMSPVTMKRSFSSGRLSFSRGGRGRRLDIPI